MTILTPPRGKEFFDPCHLHTHIYSIKNASCKGKEKNFLTPKKEFFDPNSSPEKMFVRRKTKRGESSETRFGKVSRQLEPCLRGKRLFEVCGGTAVGPTIEANRPFTNGRNVPGKV